VKDATGVQHLAPGHCQGTQATTRRFSSLLQHTLQQKEGVGI
jgi:hypothetical protein